MKRRLDYIRRGPFAFFVLMLLSAECSYGNPLQKNVDGFSCEKVSVSEAINLLSKKSAIIIDSIIDDVQEPLVTIPLQNGTIENLLQKILLSLPNYHVLTKSKSILVLPKGLEANKDFPLNQVLKKFTIRYNTYVNGHKERVYKCEFADRRCNQLNIPREAFFLKSKPDFQEFPAFVRFENQALLDIVISISEKEQMPWCCSKQNPWGVHETNQWIVKYGVEKSWEDESKPCYCIMWGKGGHHGKGRPDGTFPP